MKRPHTNVGRYDLSSSAIHTDRQMHQMDTTSRRDDDAKSAALHTTNTYVCNKDMCDVRKCTYTKSRDHDDAMMMVDGIN